MVLWQVGDYEQPFTDGFAQLEERNGEYEFMVSDGAEGVRYKVTTEQLLDLAFTIYEELG